MRATLDTLAALRIKVQTDGPLTLTEVPSVSALARLPQHNGGNGVGWYTGGYFKTRDEAQRAIGRGQPPALLVKRFTDYRQACVKAIRDLTRKAPSARRKRVW